jgi:hypothetical protein
MDEVDIFGVIVPKADAEQLRNMLSQHPDGWRVLRDVLSDLRVTTLTAGMHPSTLRDEHQREVGKLELLNQLVTLKQYVRKSLADSED